ncbi:MAG TPA: peptidylprolyl isomerase [Candidatus Dormibacteraeota bacterium]|nr:peptidylprolyl isomerase [Candidatus Dormibacteraeota bacterium]
MIKKKNTRFLLFFVVLFVMAGCGTSSNNEQTNDKSSDESNNNLIEDNPIVTITMENDEQIIIELFPNIAPNTVNNFISLIEDGFYDGLIFHRVIPDFMVQGGDPDGIGTGGPGYSIKGEFNNNGFTNDLTHERGVISMARSQHPDSAGSQFFIVHKNSPHLDDEYAGFGQVLEGIEVVDQIASVNRDGSDKPLEDQVMKSVTVDTKGHEYDQPEVE